MGFFSVEISARIVKSVKSYKPTKFLLYGFERCGSYKI